MVEKNRRNYYRVLHVQPDAPMPIIKSSYRALMLSLEMHPDYGGDHWNAALINEAYEVLSNPEQRAAYDLNLGTKNRRQSRSEPPPHVAGLRCVFCGTSTKTAAGPTCSTCKSPMSVPEKIEARGAGARLADRVKLHAKLEYFTRWPQGQPHLGMLVDLSPNGLRFKGDQPVEEHGIIKVESALISATARVVYCRSGLLLEARTYTVGADFYTLAVRTPTGTFVSTRA